MDGDMMERISGAPGRAFVEWQTISGDHYEGSLVEWDNMTAIVMCTDGVTRAVRADDIGYIGLEAPCE